MDDLVVWLRQQLDEDERIAQAVQEAGGPWYSVHILEVNWRIGRVDAEHIARHDPARVLREVEAKRRILDGHAEDSHWCPMGVGGVEWLLALPYSDRPGYREEWK